LAVLYWPSALAAASRLDLPLADKAVHAAVFALVMWLWAGRGRRIWLVAALLAANAGLSEVVQALWLPQRSGDLWDVIADLAGIGLGAWLAAQWPPASLPPRSRPPG
jgi:hypothetical protein